MLETRIIRELSLDTAAGIAHLSAKMLPMQNEQSFRGDEPQPQVSRHFRLGGEVGCLLAHIEKRFL